MCAGGQVAVHGGAGGNMYCVVLDELHMSVMGTSASAPVFAGMVALLNAQRLQAGKPPLGFLNPWLYQTRQAHADAFFDVTVGTNSDSDKYGFTAAAGWDPVTGVGTPNFARLLTLV